MLLKFQLKMKTPLVFRDYVTETNLSNEGSTVSLLRLSIPMCILWFCGL
jgi:hypothetical protein